MSSRWLVVAALVGALIGFGFAAASTYDFAAHLDRQVHNLHCSFIPGMASTPAAAEGCQATLMSPYSSIFRTSLWGGIPISLPAMSMFAAIAALTSVMLLLRAEREQAAVFALLLLGIVPLVASLFMGSIAIFELQAACKQCIGIYFASAVIAASAVLAYRKRPRTRTVGEPPGAAARFGRAWLLSLPLTAMLVLVPMTSYVLAMPAYQKFSDGCGSLPQPEDRHGVLVPLTAEGAGTRPAIEILDPLCPACRAFEQRLRAAGLHRRIRRELLMFPLDSSCNWMVGNSLHPGACDVSAAVLCAGDRAATVLEWAFEEQDALHEAGARDPAAPGRMTSERFPDLKRCMADPKTKARLTQSLRWAVRNEIPVLTPQFYVDGKRLCDEDTDLGLEFTLTRMLEGGQ